MDTSTRFNLRNAHAYCDRLQEAVDEEHWRTAWQTIERFTSRVEVDLFMPELALARDLLLLALDGNADGKRIGSSIEALRLASNRAYGDEMSACDSFGETVPDFMLESFSGDQSDGLPATVYICEYCRDPNNYD